MQPVFRHDFETRGARADHRPQVGRQTALENAPGVILAGVTSLDAGK